MSLYKDASLVMIPSAYKDGKLYSIRPTDGDGDFTFSRGSNLAATRVDVNGLIEKGRENVLRQSNQFDTTWLQSGTITRTSGQSGYDGTSDAWLLDKGSASAYIYQSVSNSGVATFSCYVKAGTTDWFRVRINTTSTTQSCFYDLTNGVIGTDTSIESKMESIGNGWYRCILTLNATTTEVRLYPADGNLDLSGTSGNIYIQDAQLEQGLVATDYIETGASTAQAGILEDMPRLDYSGSCPSLLLEPQRSNLIDNSEYFNGWQNGGGTQTIVVNASTSPQGLQNASSIQIDSGYVYRQISSLSISVGDKYVWSCYVNSSSQKLTFGGGTPSGTDVYSSEDVGSGWYRQILTRTFTSSGSAIQPMFNDTQSGTDLFYIWGAQVESGSYPTSYIPTYGTSQTRSVEQAYTLEDSSLFDLEQGTFFLEMSALEDDNTDRKISISDGTNNNMVTIGYSRFTGNINGEVHSNGVLQTSGFAATGVTQTNNNKFALVWGNGEFRFYLNGVKTSELSISNSPVGMDILRFAQGNNSQRAYLNNKQIVLFPTALTDSECIALTTL
jgi:hypothetical protein